MSQSINLYVYGSYEATNERNIIREIEKFWESERKNFEANDSSYCFLSTSAEFFSKLQYRYWQYAEKQREEPLRELYKEQRFPTLKTRRVLTATHLYVTLYIVHHIRARQNVDHDLGEINVTVNRKIVLTFSNEDESGMFTQ